MHGEALDVLQLHMDVARNEVNGKKGAARDLGEIKTRLQRVMEDYAELCVQSAIRQAASDHMGGVPILMSINTFGHGARR
jgi:hypothetical protein